MRVWSLNTNAACVSHCHFFLFRRWLGPRLPVLCYYSHTQETGEWQLLLSHTKAMFSGRIWLCQIYCLTLQRTLAFRLYICEWQWAARPWVWLRMATSQIRIGWSLRAPKTKTRSRNLNPNRKLIRVQIHHQYQTRGYPKPEWKPETRG
jgi:hypothetical protein